MLAAIERRYGIADYATYFAKLVRQLNERRIGSNTYRKVPWPDGYVPKKRRR